jgi:hypothetical protein
MDEIEGQKWKCVLRYTDFMFDRSRRNQKVRVPEFTFSLLPLSLVHFGFCTNLVGFRFSSLNKLVERTASVNVSGWLPPLPCTVLLLRNWFCQNTQPVYFTIQPPWLWSRKVSDAFLSPRPHPTSEPSILDPKTLTPKPYRTLFLNPKPLTKALHQSPTPCTHKPWRLNPERRSLNPES